MEMPNLIQNNETGLLIPAEEENPRVLADKMYNLIKDESFFRNVQMKQDYYKAEYSWDTVAKKNDFSDETGFRSGIILF